MFFRRACQRKNKKSGVSAAKIEFGVYRQTETDAYRRRFFLYMRELSAIIYVPEFKGSRNCEIVAVIIAILVFVGVIVLAVWGGILISDYNNRCGIIPISAAAVISLAQITAGIILRIKNSK